MLETLLGESVELIVREIQREEKEKATKNEQRVGFGRASLGRLALPFFESHAIWRVAGEMSGDQRLSLAGVRRKAWARLERPARRRRKPEA